MRYFLLPAFGIAQFLHAQPVLNQAGMTPPVGHTVHFLDAPYVAPGAGGANVTWNFASLAGTPSVSFQYITPSTGQGASSYPTANLAWNSDGQIYNYQRVEATGIQDLGVHMVGLGGVVASDPQRVMAFPCTYNTTWSDNYTNTGTIAGFAVSISGSVQCTADGYGTLVLPHGTYTNVLRVRQVRNFTSTILGTSTPTSEVFHYWFRPGNAVALLQISESTTSGEVERELRYLAAGSMGLAPVAEGAMELAPNPARDQLRVDCGHAMVGGRITVVDMSGRTVAEQRVVSPTVVLSVGHLPRGSYIVRSTSTTGADVRRRLQLH